VNPRPGALDVGSIELDRSVANNNFLRVRARVRNTTSSPMKSVTVTFVMWVDGSPETNDSLTGEPMTGGGAYSEYPLALGDLAPGQTKTFETITTVANPDKLDFSNRIIELNVASASDSFAVRRLRYGFKATVGR
jgi:hypothetical protein